MRSMTNRIKLLQAYSWARASRPEPTLHATFTRKSASFVASFVAS